MDPREEEAAQGRLQSDQEEYEPPSAAEEERTVVAGRGKGTRRALEGVSGDGWLVVDIDHWNCVTNLLLK